MRFEVSMPFDVEPVGGDLSAYLAAVQRAIATNDEGAAVRSDADVVASTVVMHVALDAESEKVAVKAAFRTVKRAVKSLDEAAWSGWDLNGPTHARTC